MAKKTNGNGCSDEIVHKQLIRIAKFMGWDVKRSRKTGWGSGDFGGVDYVEFKNGNQIIIGPGENRWNTFANLDHGLEVVDLIRRLDDHAHFSLTAHAGRRELRSSHGDWICSMNTDKYPVCSPLCKTRAEAVGWAVLIYILLKDAKLPNAKKKSIYYARNVKQAMEAIR